MFPGSRMGSVNNSSGRPVGDITSRAGHPQVGNSPACTISKSMMFTTESASGSPTWCCPANSLPHFSRIFSSSSFGLRGEGASGNPPVRLGADGSLRIHFVAQFQNNSNSHPGVEMENEL